MVTPLSRFKTKEDISPYLEDENKLIYPIAENILFLSGHIIDPYEDKYQVFDKNAATIAGLYIKQNLLYSEYIEAYKADKIYMCLILQRIIYEAYIKMHYLIKYGKSAQDDYRLQSYKNRYKFYEEYKEFEGYYKVRNEKFLQDLKDDGFEIADFEKILKSSRHKKKNMQHLIAEFDNEKLYTSLYGLTSDSIHSDWGDIRQVYISKTDDGNYVPMIYTNKHFRILIPLVSLMIDASFAFLKWDKNQSYITVLSEHKRVVNLINECIFDEYNKPSSRYMKE